MAGRISNWGARHGHALVSTTGHLMRHGMATTLTVLAISLALALPLALNVVVRNVRGAGGSFADAIGLSVYLKPGTSEQRARALAAAARARADVASVTLITATQGLAQLRAQSGIGAALDTLPDNPLPTVLEVRPTASAAVPQRLDALRSQLAGAPEVESVQLDRDWAVRFDAIVELVRRLLWISALLLAAGAVAVIGNTIRLEIQSRGAQIEVTRLVGGSNAFVRRPFLYAGVLYGLAAGLAAWIIVALAGSALAGQAERLAAAYGGSFVLRGPSATELGTALGAGAVLGWLGAAIAAGRQLSRISPRSR
ncbi:MAG TPA: permease-like cell division protein FtsX [Steroidobacteraceae bacterium]|jgi:cell division transport system permease protein|nr:permease-like cell division protein FtsX [Steroidobacteraceae bacterium]